MGRVGVRVDADDSHPPQALPPPPPPFHSYPSLSILARHVSFRTPSTVDQPAGYVRHAWKRLAFACAAEGVVVMFMYNLIVHELIGEIIMKWTTHNGGYGSALASSAVS